MVNGSTHRSTDGVTPMPRQWDFTRCNAPKSTFGNMGLIVNRTSNAVSGLTPAISVRPLNRKGAGMQFPCPQREIAFTQAHEAGRGPFPGQIARYIDHQ